MHRALGRSRRAHRADDGAREPRRRPPRSARRAWLEVARLAEELGKLDQAARAYDLALIEDPGHVGALDARGALAFRLGDWATADLIYRDLAPSESVLGADELALRRSIIAEQLGRDERGARSSRKQAAAAAPGRRDVVMRVQELATATRRAAAPRSPPRAPCSSWSRSTTTMRRSRRASRSSSC